MTKGCLFDFNGTLFFDHEYNKTAWMKLLKEIDNKTIDINSFYNQHKGINNYLTITDYFKECDIEYTEDIVSKLVHKKEEYYQAHIIRNNLAFMPEGAKDLLNYLKSKDIKLNMATNSIKYNCDFYFKYFNLKNWFNQEIISYDDGSYVDKVDMYKKAAQRIGLDIKECVVFEDSPHAIENAVKAGCKKIIFVNSQNVNFKCPEIIQEIHEYRDIDISLFA